MTAVWLGLMAAVKSIFLRVLSEKFFVWFLFWSAEMLAASTKTTKDDAFVEKVKELYEQNDT